MSRYIIIITRDAIAFKNTEFPLGNLLKQVELCINISEKYRMKMSGTFFAFYGFAIGFRDFSKKT